MNKLIAKLYLMVVMLAAAPAAFADSYRYMHVTIDTPWMIFIFLLLAVLAPFILMVALYWYNAFKRSAEADEEEEQSKAGD